LDVSMFMRTIEAMPYEEVADRWFAAVLEGRSHEDQWGELLYTMAHIRVSGRPPTRRFADS